MAKTIYNDQELSGMIKMLIELFETNEGRINEDYGLGFNILKIDKTYNVTFYWVGKNVLVALSGHDHEAEYEQEELEDDFKILEDESLSMLEQYVTDILDKVKQTEI